MGLGIAGLEQLEPGLTLASELSAIDSSDLSAHDRITVLKAHQRLAAHHQALAYQQMAAIASHFVATDHDYELAYDSAVVEIAAALRLTRRAAEFELDTAIDLFDRLPQVGEALRAGRIDLRRARTFRYGTCHLEDDTARSIVAGVMARAERMTTGQLDAFLRRQCLKHDPEAARLRYQKAVRDRRLVLEPNASGTAHLYGLDLSPELAAEALARICDLAETAKQGDDLRSADQVRADVFLDLLLGRRRYQEKHGVINIHVDLQTLTRLADDPGELAGYGPIIADLARQVAEQQRSGQWRYTISDAETGQAIANGITRRRPTAAQRRQVEALNPTCIHPGCRAPAINSDLDHRLEYRRGGPTRTRNLDPLCRFHHTIRHRAGWTHQPLPDGDHLFTSRLGHQYTTSGRSP